MRPLSGREAQSKEKSRGRKSLELGKEAKWEGRVKTADVLGLNLDSATFRHRSTASWEHSNEPVCKCGTAKPCYFCLCFSSSTVRSISVTTVFNPIMFETALLRLRKIFPLNSL